MVEAQKCGGLIENTWRRPLIWPGGINWLSERATWPSGFQGQNGCSLKQATSLVLCLETRITTDYAFCQKKKKSAEAAEVATKKSKHKEK